MHVLLPDLLDRNCSIIVTNSGILICDAKTGTSHEFCMWKDDRPLVREALQQLQIAMLQEGGEEV